ncbi:MULTISPECIES: adenosylcobinamide-GDP ribazoletransferase [unclassified Pseudofrankia]|uniref:adenosylcobinamide-GDP ribazoletransferase n=1 Tax=unclassified Pseudofrankia TaxID=2994372 RepID=UPI0008DB203A|nr:MULTISPECIES: adenosylcobinamide-GDP ribazoletransferase [unclassified Pseudofrankia]MDT3446122.1 adenosylcobinamide-GDP ribazoletransferase [Pseudofrankia sp. BMG5.37]OHV58073.1 hypothetical protein BCD48_06245 [Pseudofrankia sp. BMG5.36]
MSLRTMLAVLTAAPVRPTEPVSRTAASRLTTLAPLGGLLLGLVTAVVVVTIRVWAELPGGEPQSLLPAAGGLALLALATGARHLTGLAAVADALAGDRARRDAPVWDAPADSPGGALTGVGAVTVLFTVLIQVFALSTAILAHRGTVSILVACLASRLAVTLAGARLSREPEAGEVPATRLSARAAVPAASTVAGAAVSRRRIVVGQVSTSGAALATVLSFVLATIAGRLDYDGGDPSRALRAVVALALATAAGLLLRRFLARRLGGTPAPVLCAIVELTVTVALITMAFTIPGRIQDAIGG